MHTDIGFARRSFPASAASTALAVCALLAAGAVTPSLAGDSNQATFPSPDDAGHALASAVEKHDERTVNEIVGGGSGLVRADDEAEDALEQETFTQKYKEMHRWVRRADGIEILYIGAENWPFPIPLVSRNGAWRFDSKAGSDEILFRRIGENEVTAILTCDALVTAKTHPGTDSETDRLAETLLGSPQVASKTKPYHGYYFNVRQSSTGGFTAVAYPAVYRSSGVMTFFIAPDGGVSEKDLGPGTSKIAGTMTVSVDSSWSPVEAPSP